MSCLYLQEQIKVNGVQEGVSVPLPIRSELRCQGGDISECSHFFMASSDVAYGEEWDGPRMATTQSSQSLLPHLSVLGPQIGTWYWIIFVLATLPDPSLLFLIGSRCCPNPVPKPAPRDPLLGRGVHSER